MALIRWEPVRELHTIQNEMNRLFGTLFEAPNGLANSSNGSVRRWIPAMDLVEAEDEFVLRADLPGLTDNDVNIDLEDHLLTISGERHADEARNEGYYRVERPSGSFSRSLALPEGVDPEAVRANFEHGVLEVRIAKPETRKPRKVAISVGGGAARTIEGSETAGDSAGAEQTA